MEGEGRGQPRAGPRRNVVRLQGRNRLANELMKSRSRLQVPPGGEWMKILCSALSAN